MERCALRLARFCDAQTVHWKAALRELRPRVCPFRGLHPRAPVRPNTGLYTMAAVVPRIGTGSPRVYVVRRHLRRRKRWPRKDRIPLDDGGFGDPQGVYGSESKSTTMGTHGFIPLSGSVWDRPHAMPPVDLLGDELELVKAGVEFIEEHPDHDRGRTVDSRCADEVMNNAQSDTTCISKPST